MLHLQCLMYNSILVHSQEELYFLMTVQITFFTSLKLTWDSRKLNPLVMVCSLLSSALVLFIFEYHSHYI